MNDATVLPTLSLPLRRFPVVRAARAGLATALACWAVLAVLAAAVRAQGPDAAGPFFRIFLTDGTTLTSYGDFAQVDGRVVFSLPMGELQGQPRLHLASVPSAEVDWATTERYREATRAAQYAATRGDEDFAVLSAEVAQLLNEIALAPEPQRRLSLANEARARLATWPAEHHGYRADEVRQILALVDEVISDLRAAAGESRFDISLVAGIVEPPRLAPLPPPSLQESIVQALWAARLAPSAAERRALLEAAVGTLDVHAETLPVGWVTSTRERATSALAREAALDARLRNVRAGAFSSVERLAARGDVNGVERVVRAVQKDTEAIAAERGDEVQALLRALEARLDATRRLRLALDRWELKAEGLRRYEKAVDSQLRELARGTAALDDIRTLAGPSSDVLTGLERRVAAVAWKLGLLAVPADGRAIHAVATSAAQLAANAARLRRSAIASGDLQQAWDASAAAAGAIMLMDRARQDLARLVEPPTLQ
jgi:hypothetical protein